MSHDVAAAPQPLLGYARVSTAEQDISIDAQRTALEAAAAARGWDGLEVVIDHGHSGSSLDRPGVADVLARMAPGGVLLVVKLDRLSRSLADFVAVLERARAGRWRLVALDVGIDMTTPAGELVATIFAALAQWERRVIADRTRVALAELRAQGQRLGRPSLIPPQVLERIVAERAAGRGLQAIADDLTADGIPTARGGAAWRKSSIASALRTAALDAEAAGAAAFRQSREESPGRAL